MITSNEARTLEATNTGEVPASQNGSSASGLPDEPLMTIQASKAWAALNLRDVWAHRELLFFLTLRDLKVRYKQTVLGMAWVVMQPLLTTIIFSIFLGRLVGVGSDGLPYPLFVFAGMLPWTFFTSAVNSGSNSLVGNGHLITKVYFPRLILPVSAILARLVDFFIAFTVLVVLMVYYKASISWNILMLPVCIALVMFLALGIGMASSALNVKYRDIGVIVPLLLQLWLFASPIVYPVSLVPQEWQRLYFLNPIAGIVEGFRSSLFNRGFNWSALGISAVISLALFVFAAFLFRRMEARFADIV